MKDIKVPIPRVALIGECQTVGCGYAVYIHYYDCGKIYIRKLVLLNALVPPAGKGAVVVTAPITVEQAKCVLDSVREFESYIGHEATAQLLSGILGRPVQVSRAMWIPEDDTHALIVRLKRRLEKPEDVKSITESDIELRLAYYFTKVPED